METNDSEEITVAILGIVWTALIIVVQAATRFGKNYYLTVF
jgi:hypothetical protein